MFLVCIPLPLEGVDGSPVRPVLFEIFWNPPQLKNNIIK
jgi:hypothetical protein